MGIITILYGRLFVDMPGLYKNIFVFLLIGFYSLNLLAATDEDKYLELRNSYNELKQNKKKRQYRVYWSRISSELIKLSEKAEPKLKVRIYFTLGELFRDLRKITLSPYDFESAIEYYKKVYSEFPDSNLADDALYYTGKLYLEVENDTDQAISFFEKITTSYAKGDYFDKASTILNSLGTNVNQKKEVSKEQKETQEIEKKKSEKKKEEEKETEVKESDNLTQEQVSLKLINLENVILKISEEGAICELMVSGNVRYLYKELPEDKKNNKPPRIYIDLIDTRLGENIEKFKSIEKGFIKTIRLGQFADNTVRIVFDLVDIKTYLIFLEENPYKIVVHFGDVTNQTNMTSMEMRQTEKATAPGKIEPSAQKVSDESQKVKKGDEEESKDAINLKIVESMKDSLRKNISEKKADSIPLSKQLGLKVKRIIIDAGHGGDDFGAIGKSGLKEKDVVLDIALELLRIIKKNTDIEAILTRNTDTTLKLSERAALAREKKADLFISIHANANKNKKFSGVEVYYLNNTDDRASQKVAMLENVNSDKSISDLKMTLLDLAISANVDESMRMAQYVQEGIVSKLRKKYPDVKDRGVKYALFYVLFGTEIPSILVETSFISNPVEEKRLKSKEYKKLIAEGIYEGIMKYIKGTEE